MRLHRLAGYIQIHSNSLLVGLHRNSPASMSKNQHEIVKWISFQDLIVWEEIRMLIAVDGLFLS